MGLGYQDIKPVLDPVVQELAKLYGERLSKIALYGSYARGEASEESDVDLLVLLEKSEGTYAELDRICDITSQALDAGVLISSFPLAVGRFGELQKTFRQNIEEDMQVLWPH
jgi:uncharacterized protein